MSLITEYVDKRWSPQQFQAELGRLIASYNKCRGTYLLVYASSPVKQVPEKLLLPEDYYAIYDLLKGRGDKRNLDIYLETGGGSAEAVEEIVKFLRSRFDNIAFVISGQAKSAGTIFALSGDEIFMTETGSLGPIDAQVRLGRYTGSAFDYVEWVEEKRKEAEITGKLNPLDATIAAQITPSELRGVFHNLEYAKDLVIEWLPKYKFKNWSVTAHRGIPVTEEMKQGRAAEIADELCNHAKWRAHGRSIKIDDLKGLLLINRVEDQPELLDIVNRIHVVSRLLFDMTNIFKIFATADTPIFRRQGQPAGPPLGVQLQAVPGGVETIEIDHRCNNCGQVHRLYAKLEKDPQLDSRMVQQGRIPFPAGNKIACRCGLQHDLTPIRNDLEKKVGKKFVP